MLGTISGALARSLIRSVVSDSLFMTHFGGLVLRKL